MYIPKNKIKTNLYTKGEEYKNVVTGVPYTGYYWTMYTGKRYADIDSYLTETKSYL